ncbi:hypothetical protein CRG98_036513 [Punica granatum]|uniref:Uncharacterized protein n=1 Tax=Punica granatum TaxID=22663 RepID=A0A2I0IGB5_PUNGR|nr:hypothetical protein CRG98_036513 [Punica granatum]
MGVEIHISKSSVSSTFDSVGFVSSLLKQRVSERGCGGVGASTCAAALRFQAGSHHQVVAPLLRDDPQVCNFTAARAVKHEIEGPRTLDEVLNCFHSMTLIQPPPHVFEFCRLLGAVVRMRHYSAAISLIERMDVLGLACHIFIWNIFINCLCHLKEVDLGIISRAVMLADEMLNFGFEPDSFTCATIIKGLVRNGTTDLAVGLIGKWEKEMVQRGILPNINTFSILVDAFCKEGQPSEAEHVFEMTAQKGAEPNVVTYNSIIDGYFLHNRVDAAAKLFGLMIERNYAPNVVTYNALINGYCKGFCLVGNLHAAEQLFEKIQSPNVQSYAIMLDGLRKAKQMDKAIAMFQQMENHKLEPNIVIYNILIHGLCTAGKLDSARELFEVLSEKKIKPNVKAFTALINGLCNEGHISEAFRLFNEREGRGCVPDVGSYNVLVRGFIRIGDKLRVEQLL